MLNAERRTLNVESSNRLRYYTDFLLRNPAFFVRYLSFSPPLFHLEVTFGVENHARLVTI